MPPPPTRRPPEAPRRASAGLRALAVVGLTALVVLGAATATPWRTNIPWHLLDRDPVGLPQLSNSIEPSPSPQAPLPTAEPDTTVTLVIALVFAGIVFALLLALAARRILSTAGRPPDVDLETIRAGTSVDAPPPSAITPDQLQDAVTRALAHLDGAATPHDAVVAAWVALEDAATRHGTPRDPAQTPTEFTVDMLDATPAPAADLDTLRRLYHHARFTTHPVTDDQVAAARTALEHIARTLDPADRP